MSVTISHIKVLNNWKATYPVWQPTWHVPVQVLTSLSCVIAIWRSRFCLAHTTGLGRRDTLRQRAITSHVRLEQGSSHGTRWVRIRVDAHAFAPIPFYEAVEIGTAAKPHVLKGYLTRTSLADCSM